VTEATIKPRIDKYLWAIRLFKTRNAAALACEKGKVLINGQPAKAGRPVKVGDQFEVKAEARKWKFTVTGLLQQRLSFSEVQKYYEDQTPEEEKQIKPVSMSSFFTGKRLSKTGKPTKKERRDFNNFFE
jgi:ribosome-associated heat shock protein Hsp15